MGVNGAHNTIGKNVGAYSTVCVRAVRRVLFLQVYRVRSLVSWFDLCALPFSPDVSWSLPSRRPRLAGPNRLFWSRLSKKRNKQVLGVSPVRERVVRVGSGAFGQAFRSERPSGGGLETEASALVREAG